jgi:hypothetical protein
MDTSSEYSFPIFISSTDYNLKDFRAELARFLKELGYRPILSSAEGFPDNSPKLEPWESCLPVLDSCFVIILVIDGKYSSALKWPNFADLFGELSFSPTQGEYMYAHKVAKRMLVFIRKEVITHYQSYRHACKNCNYDEEAIKEALKKTLPEYLDYETLKFVHQVKTSKPIPWIKEFDDVTDVKKEVQKKMLNELAEIFLVKNKHLQTVIDSFNKVLDTANTEEQKSILTKINATKPFIEAVEKIQELTKELQETKNLLEQTQGENSHDKEKYENRIKELKNEILEMEKSSEISSFDKLYLKDGKVKFANPSFLETGSFKFSPYFNFAPNNILTNFPLMSATTSYLKECAECKRLDTSTNLTSFNSAIQNSDFNDCPNCKRHLCTNCWPSASDINNDEVLVDKVCLKCKASV